MLQFGNYALYMQQYIHAKYASFLKIPLSLSSNKKNNVYVKNLGKNTAMNFIYAAYQADMQHYPANAAAIFFE